MGLKNEIERYAKLNGHPISAYEELVCNCGNTQFNLYSDDEEGGAFAQCVKCNSEYDIQQSRSYIKDEVHNICNCDCEALKIGVGRAFYGETTETRWVYVGAFCTVCELKGVYVDWKNT